MASAGVTLPGGTRLPHDVANDGDQLLAEESQLIRQAQSGDRAAFAVLIDRYWDRLYRWLYHLTHDRHAAEDLCQETLLKAFAGIQRFQVGTNFRAWLFRIAHNNYVNLHRTRVAPTQALTPDVVATQFGPEEAAVSREVLAKVAQEIARLPTDYRAVLHMRLDEGMSFRTIAAVLGITEETARWRVFKARQRLLQACSDTQEVAKDARDLEPATEEGSTEEVERDSQ
jgi:RNA polymerase sigma-70 factor (ECF subfamily)